MKKFMLILLMVMLIPAWSFAQNTFIDESANSWSALEYFPATNVNLQGGSSGNVAYSNSFISVSADSLADSAFVYVMASNDASGWTQITDYTKISTEEGAVSSVAVTFSFAVPYKYLRVYIAGATSGDTFSVLGIAYNLKEIQGKNY